MKQTNINTKRKKQGYKTRSYLILVLSKLKIMGFLRFLYPFGNLAQRSFHKNFHALIDIGNILSGFLIIRELKVN